MIDQKVAALLLAISIVASLSSCDSLSNHDEACSRLIGKGFDATAEKNYPQAQRFYEQALTESEKCSNALLLPTVLCSLSDVYIAQSNYSSAESCLRRALMVYNRLGNFSNRAPTVPVQTSKDTDQNKRNIDQPVEKSTAVKDKQAYRDEDLTQRRASTMAELGNVLRIEANLKLDESESLYKESLGSLNNAVSDMLLTRKVTAQYADLLKLRGRHFDAAELQENLEATDISVFEWDAQFDKGLKLFEQGQRKEAKSKFAVCMKVAQNLKSSKRLWKIWFGNAIVQTAEGEEKGATNSIAKAIAFAGVGSERGRFEIAKAMSDVAAKLKGDDDGADRICQQTGQLLSETKGNVSQTDVANVLTALGDSCRARGRMQVAQPFLEKALAIYQKAPKDRRAYIAMGNLKLGECYYGQQKFVEAKKYFQTALEIYTKLGAEGIGGMAPALARIGNAELCLGHYQTAINLFNRAMEFQKKTPDNLLRADLFTEIGDCCAKLHKPAQALANYRQAKDAIQHAPQDPDNLAKSLESRIKSLE